MDPEYVDTEKTFAEVVNDNERDKLSMNLTIIKLIPTDTEVSLFGFNVIVRIVRLENYFIF